MAKIEEAAESRALHLLDKHIPTPEAEIKQLEHRPQEMLAKLSLKITLPDTRGPT